MYLQTVISSSDLGWLASNQMVLGQRALRPFWVIAHRCNTAAKAQDALRKGANAIECDILFRKGELWARHDPLDPEPPSHDDYLASLPFQRRRLSFEDYRQRVYRIRLRERHLRTTYLPGVKLLAEKFRHFALMIFDLKDVPQDRLPTLLSSVRTHLFPTNINVIFSYPKLTQADRFSAIIPSLRDREGLSIDAEDSPEKVSARLQQLGAKRICYGNGSTGIPEFVPIW